MAAVELAVERIQPDLLGLVIDIDSVSPHPRNPNEGDAEGIGGSLTDFTQYKPIVVQASTRLILVGNHTWKGARLRGWRWIAAVLMDCDDLTALQVMAGDNQWSRRSHEKPEELAGIIGELEANNRAENIGFDRDQLDALMGRLAQDTAVDGGSGGSGGGGASLPLAPREAVEAVSRAGDVWRVGRHVVVCGDAREAGDVERLFGAVGEDAALCVTSPPYADRRAYDGKSPFKPVPPEEYGAWFRPLARLVMEHLREDGSFCLNIKPHSEEGQRSLYVADLLLQLVREGGWRFVDEFCWRNTRNGVPGTWPDRFKNAWEPVYHFALNKGFRFFPQAVAKASEQAFGYSPENSSSRSGSGIGIGSYKAGGLVAGMALPSNVIEAASESQQGGHTAPFPVQLPDFFIRALTEAGDVVYDCCGGAGTTLVAAEQAAGGPRRAALMEIGPSYCDLILRRAMRLLGVDAIRHDGVAFSDLAPVDDWPDDEDEEGYEGEDDDEGDEG